MDTAADDYLRHDKLDRQAGADVSPFTSRAVELQFQSGHAFTVHRAFLLRSPKIALLCGPSTDSIPLGDISASAGHALVRYLYTNELEILNLGGPVSVPCNPGPDLAALKTAFEVYSLARTYELDGLEQLARSHIEAVTSAAEVDPFALIDVVKEAYPRPVGDSDDDAWFPHYIRSRIKAAFRNPSSLLLRAEKQWPPDFSSGASVVKVLLSCLLEVYVESLSGGDGGAAQALDPATPVSDGSFEKVVTPGSVPEADGRVDVGDREPLRDGGPRMDSSVPDRALDGGSSLCGAVPESETERAAGCLAGSVYQLAPEPPGPLPEAVPVIEPTPAPAVDATPKAESGLDDGPLAGDTEPTTWWSPPGRKGKKKKFPLKELDPEPKPEPEPEPEPVAEENDTRDLPAMTKKKKSKKKSKVNTEPAVQTELDRDPWDFWGARRSPTSPRASC